MFTDSQVFMDVKDIHPGENFAHAIDQTVAACHAVLIVIGPRWMEILRKRLQEQQPDYVIHEAEAALAKKIFTIPVLVGGASMTQLTDLPPTLSELPLLEAIEIRDSTFGDDCVRLANAVGSAKGVKPPRLDKKKPRRLALWIGGAAALVVLVAALSLWAVHAPRSKTTQHNAQVEQILNTARVQTEQEEYESAFRSIEDALTADPGNVTLLDHKVDAAMLWAENFHVLLPEGQKAEDVAGPLLREIISTLEAGLARTTGQGSRAADILAHLGWSHWLNQHIAYKEFGATAEQLMRKALTLDPSNVYANAMLGNWLLQTDGSLKEAVQCFDVAVKTGKQRSLVRAMELGGMIYNDAPGVRAELIRVANQMRINSEVIDDGNKHRILSEYEPSNGAELKETLSAVPPNDAWATYLWLDANERNSDAKYRQFQHDFIHANILEMVGKRDEALGLFKTLQGEVKSNGFSPRLGHLVDVAVKRLSG